MVALLVAGESHHRSVRDFVQRNQEPIVLPGTTVAEIAYFLALRTTTRDEANFLRAIADTRIAVVDPTLADYGRAADLVEQYAGFPLGAVDALIAAMAERLRVTTLFTLDRRHFGAIRPAHCEAFQLVP
jgi:predicted nucleic acid-binding protein